MSIYEESIMKRIFLALCVAFLGFLTITGCATTASIESPVAQSIPAGLTYGEVKNVLVAASSARGWTISKSTQGKLEMFYARGKVSANICVDYDTSNYTISYVSSTGMKAAGGKIHKNYNRWVRNLVKDYNIALANAKASK